MKKFLLIIIFFLVSCSSNKVTNDINFSNQMSFETFLKQTQRQQYIHEFEKTLSIVVFLCPQQRILVQEIQIQ